MGWERIKMLGEGGSSANSECIKFEQEYIHNKLITSNRLMGKWREEKYRGEISIPEMLKSPSEIESQGRFLTVRDVNAGPKRRMGRKSSLA